jgi:hypothetical protein
MALGKTRAELRQGMSNLEFLDWWAYFARAGQLRELRGG